MALYDKPVKHLFREMVEDLAIRKGDVTEREKIQAWFKQKYPLIKKSTISAHLIRMSTNAPSRIHHTIDPNGNDDLLFQIDTKKFRLYDPSTDPDPIYFKPKQDESEKTIHSSIESENGNEFAYEKDLQNFLAKNLSLVESGLKLYMEEEISGIEFPVGSRFIDILATDRDENYVVPKCLSFLYYP